MAPKKAPSSSPIPIGDCEVIVEANKFTCESDPRSLQICFSRNAKVKISVREHMNMQSGNGMCPAKSEGNGKIVSCCPDEYMFVLVNPKDDDASTKSYIQEVLNLYMKELSAMNYAANTGKQSLFLERCVSKGKYCTLLLKSKLKGASEEIIAAITYQIVPADTQFAEIPLAAVASIYKNKGFGQLIYKELRKRLQNVGIRAVFCWGDKESEGFWLKQGFTSIAEVDQKGKARKLRVKANIRKALCFPGGSTLMLSHLNKDSSVNCTNLLRSCSQLKPCDKPPLFASNKSRDPGSDRDCDNILKPVNQAFFGIETSQPRESGKEGSSESMALGGFSAYRVSMDPATSGGVECNNMTTDAATGADGENNHFSGSIQGVKRVWEASLSSLKSKRVKGTHHCDCQLDMDCTLTSERERKQIKDKSSLDISAADPLCISHRRNDAGECGTVCRTTESLLAGETQPYGEHYRIMLMNIADENKRACLTKVIENLGGVVTSDGSVSTHIVTGKVRKTLNFCTALCAGAWIVSPTWLKESFRERRFVDESSFILHDEDYLMEYQIELKSAVLRAKARPQALLKGYDICTEGHVQPHVGALSAIVRSAGGNAIRGLEKVREARKTIFIACEEDMEEALSAGKKGIRTFSSDWLMNCVMRQELDLEAPQFAESL